MVVFIVAVQVRLTGVPSYSVVVLEGLVMVSVSWGGGTDTNNTMHVTKVKQWNNHTFYL